MRHWRRCPGHAIFAFCGAVAPSGRSYYAAAEVMNLARSRSSGCPTGARRHHPSIRTPPRRATPAFLASAPAGRNARRSTSMNLRNGPSARGLGERRRSRGTSHSARHERPILGSAALPDVANYEDVPVETTTRYTIDDSVCPPTEPDALRKIVRKHIRTLPKYWESKPVARHTAEAFEEALEFIIRYDRSSGGDSRVKVILDSGCGIGRSSFLLGDMYRDCVVIGIDKSLARLSSNKLYNRLSENDYRPDALPGGARGGGNVLLLRAELSDFWKCCLSSARWWHHARVCGHYLLYPNPYPKRSRLKSRFYAHPAFPMLMMTLLMDNMDEDDDQEDVKTMGRKRLVVRSNWKGYLDEFKMAVDVWNTEISLKEVCAIMMDCDELHEWQLEEASFKWEMRGPERLVCDGNMPLTNFETKYFECGEPVYELSVLKPLQGD